MIVELPVTNTGDLSHREEALDPTRSFIVEAPAGSGKTSLLVQRYLRLLSGVARPQSVVAMTFTRKAAAELKERVVTALEQASAKTPVRSPYEQRTRELALAALRTDNKQNWGLLNDPSQLQILTIDALCASITRQMPVVSNFGGTPEVVEDASELYRLAARSTLRKLSESSPQEQEIFRAIVLHFDSNLSELQSQIARMLDVRDQCSPILRSPHPSQLVEHFRQLLIVAQHELQEVFRQKGQVDFTAVTRAAIEALGTPESPTDLLYSLDYRVEHLLVDEFQDTSRAQYDLIQALTEQWSVGDGHTLFLVGDPMQSIYGFREAEVSLFLKSCEGQLGSVPVTPLRLSTNFRSSPEILRWIESAIAPAMKDEDLSLGAVRFRRSEAGRSTTTAHPTLHAFIEDRDGTQEAERMLEVIRSARKKKRSIAILVRNRAHVLSVLPLLRNARIRYEAVEIDPLAEEQHILDLVSLTRALLHVADRTSWLACLRAPWCGLQATDLLSLVRNQPKAAVIDLLSDPDKIATLALEGRDRAVRFQEILTAALAQVGHLSLRDLVERTWIALGGPAALDQPNQRQDIETYLLLVERFEQGGVIRDFSLLTESLEHLYAKSLTEGDRVQILTIHKAKGLEFDTVLLPRLAGGPRTRDKDLLVWSKIGDDPLCDTNDECIRIAALPQSGEDDPEYEAISSLLKAKERNEDARLLYVAMTRAKDELHLFGSVRLSKNGFSKAGSHTHLGMIWAHAKPYFEEALRSRDTSPQQANLSFEPRTELRRLPLSWRAPELERSIDWQPAHRLEIASARKVTYEWVSDTGRHVGTVVHELLKRISAEGLNHWPASRIAKATDLVRSELLRLGVTRSEAPAAVERAVRAITTTTTSHRGRWILGAQTGAKTEWPIGGLVGDKLVTGTIDRLFRDHDGRLWIIDFKTSEHQGGSQQKFLDEEQRRYHDQLDKYATLLSKMMPGPISLGLYFPLLNAWREWEHQAQVLTANE